jgi:hypothetical protein
VRRVALAAMIVLAAADLARAASDVSAPVAMLTGVQGRVTLRRAGAKKEARPQLMDLLAPGDRLRLRAGARAEALFFSDGHVEVLAGKSMAEVGSAKLEVRSGKKAAVLPPAGADAAGLVQRGPQTLAAQPGERLGALVMRARTEAPPAPPAALGASSACTPRLFRALALVEAGRDGEARPALESVSRDCGASPALLRALAGLYDRAGRAAEAQKRRAQADAMEREAAAR